MIVRKNSINENIIKIIKSSVGCIFFVSLTFFLYTIMFLITQNMTDNIIASLKIMDKLFYPKTWFLAQLPWNLQTRLRNSIWTMTLRKDKQGQRYFLIKNSLDFSCFSRCRIFIFSDLKKIFYINKWLINPFLKIQNFLFQFQVGVK